MRWLLALLPMFAWGADIDIDIRETNSNAEMYVLVNVTLDQTDRAYLITGVATIAGAPARRFTWYPRKLVLDKRMKKSWYRHIPVVFGNHRYCVSVSVRVRSSMAPYDWSVNKQHCETFNIPPPYVPPVEYEWQYVYRPPSYNMNCSFNFFGELGDAWMVCMPEPFFGF